MGMGIGMKLTAMTWKLDKETRTTIGKDGGSKGAKRGSRVQSLPCATHTVDGLPRGYSNMN